MLPPVMTCNFAPNANDSFLNIKFKQMKRSILLIMISAFLIESGLFAQNDKVQIGMIGHKFTDFTLTTYQGKQISTKDLRGKNILLISSRGKYQDNAWCALCHYQYVDFADLELTQKIREKYNMEIIFLLPYDKDTVDKWVKLIPSGIADVESWKNPKEPINEGQKNWAELIRTYFPKKFDFTNKNVPLPLPIAMDEKQEVSKGLDIYRTEWSGTKTQQNIPTVYVIDKKGIVRFKYISQSTVDRPSSEYILDIISRLE
jgi:peroxiredoxin